MPVDWSKLRSLAARELISALESDGFKLRRQSGGHRRYQHPDGRKVTVSFHSSGETFPAKTLRKMMEDQAKWTESDLKKLGLLK